MLPAIAATAISEYTQPGDLVLDPMCGIGTSLVEAVHLARAAIGVEYEPAWAQLARRNLHHAASQGATGSAHVIHGDARNIDALLDPDMVDRVALVLTSPPYGSSLHGHVDARPGRGVRKSNYRYSRDRANLAHTSLDQLVSGFVGILTGCLPFLRPGGIVAMTVRPYWHRGTLIDLPGRLSAAITEHTDLQLLDRNVALLAGLRDNKLVPRASFFQLDQVRKARAVGVPRRVIAHEDVLVLIKPQAAKTLSGQRIVHRRTARSSRLRTPRRARQRREHDAPSPLETTAPRDASELDMTQPVERPSTHDETIAPAKEPRRWQTSDRARRRRASPATAKTTTARIEPGAEARDAPVRVLAADHVPLDPQHRDQAVRALTEMILSWMQRRNHSAAVHDIDRAA
jgi:SAM-dependent methyltransferase